MEILNNFSLMTVSDSQADLLAELPGIYAHAEVQDYGDMVAFCESIHTQVHDWQIELNRCIYMEDPEIIYFFVQVTGTELGNDFNNPKVTGESKLFRFSRLDQALECYNRFVITAADFTSP